MIKIPVRHKGPNSLIQGRKKICRPIHSLIFRDTSQAENESKSREQVLESTALEEICRVAYLHEGRKECLCTTAATVLPNSRTRLVMKFFSRVCPFLQLFQLHSHFIFALWAQLSKSRLASRSPNINSLACVWYQQMDVRLQYNPNYSQQLFKLFRIHTCQRIWELYKDRDN